MSIRDRYFYFVAQTGRISKEPISGNFHCYKLPAFEFYLKVKKAVSLASLGSGGLEYPKEFLEEINKEDRA